MTVDCAYRCYVDNGTRFLSSQYTVEANAAYVTSAVTAADLSEDGGDQRKRMPGSRA